MIPTGCGKTECFIALAERAAKLGVKSCVILNRDQLVSQTARRMRHLSPGVYSAGYGSKDLGELVTIASIQSLRDGVIPGLRLIIFDEAHNLSDGYQRFFSNHPEARIIGFTATPYRDDGMIYGAGKFFPRISFQRTMPAMIADGWIVPPVSKVPPEQFDVSRVKMRGGDFVLEELNILCSDQAKVRAQVADAIPRLAERQKVIWICVSIKHAEMVRREIERFEQAVVLHSKLDDAQKDLAIRAFETGPFRHMVTIMMVSEGYDYGPTDAIVMMRPTRSARLYVQIVGRGLRLAEGKRDCLVLDYGDVIRHLGPVSSPHVGEVRKGKARGELPPETNKVCPQCFTLVESVMRHCPDCEYTWPEREMTKTLRKEAAEVDILGAVAQPPIETAIRGFRFERYQSKAGNTCVKIAYIHQFVGETFEFISSHPFSWRKGVARIRELTGMTFAGFEDALEGLDGVEYPREGVIVTVKEKGYARVKEIRLSGEGGAGDAAGDVSRAGDSDVPF